MSKTYYVYMMTNKRNGKIHTGVTSNLVMRVDQLKSGKVKEPGAGKRGCAKLIWFDAFPSAYAAVTRERQLRMISRNRKEQLIWEQNPLWKDLSLDWAAHRIIQAGME